MMEQQKQQKSATLMKIHQMNVEGETEGCEAQRRERAIREEGEKQVTARSAV